MHRKSPQISFFIHHYILQMSCFTYIKYVKSTIYQRHNKIDGANLVYSNTHWHEFMLVNCQIIRGLKHPSYEERLRVGVVQPREEIFLQPSNILMELLKRRERNFLYSQVVTGQGTMISN